MSPFQSSKLFILEQEITLDMNSTRYLGTLKKNPVDGPTGRVERTVDKCGPKQHGPHFAHQPSHTPPTGCFFLIY
jgi:hypothetical protein